MTPRSWSAAIVAGLLVALGAAGYGGAWVYEGQQRAQCERLGHVFAPANPDARLAQCWVSSP